MVSLDGALLDASDTGFAYIVSSLMRSAQSRWRLKKTINYIKKHYTLSIQVLAAAVQWFFAQLMRFVSVRTPRNDDRQTGI